MEGSGDIMRNDCGSSQYRWCVGLEDGYDDVARV